LENRIKNVKGRSTSSEEAPEYFGAKGACCLKNEDIMCDMTSWEFTSILTKTLRLLFAEVRYRTSFISRVTVRSFVNNHLNAFNKLACLTLIKTYVLV
jgi:hypothetical protein